MKSGSVDNMNSNSKHSINSTLHRLVILSMITAAVYGISEIPYFLGYINAPDGFVFNGHLFSIDDLNMYFSYIRQAADGHVLFENRLTHVKHNPVFFNPQWLFVGFVMYFFNCSTQWAFEIWRVIGAATLVFGFAALANLVIRKHSLFLVAVIMCIFGGGFGWFFYIITRTGIINLWQWGAFDLRASLHPFVQIMFNPHFSLPLGLFCLFFMFYIKGEKSGNMRWYFAAGIIAILEGASRPYDLIALFGIVPLYIIIDLISTREVAYRHIMKRALPIIMVVPLIMYFFYLFYFHPVFKYWGSQGIMPFQHPLPWHFLNTGLAAVLCTIRLCLIRKYPLDNASRLMLAWFLSALFLTHAYKYLSFIPYSHQLSTTLMPPIILLGVVVLDREKWLWEKLRLKTGIILIVAFLIVNALSSFFAIYIHSDRLLSRKSTYYITNTEMESYAWLNKYGKESDVVLGTYETGNRLAKHASVHVVLGHWSVTPMVEEVKHKVEQFFREEMIFEEAAEFLKDFEVHWIYVGKRERELGGGYIQKLPGLRKCFDNQDVTIYATSKNTISCDVYE